MHGRFHVGASYNQARPASSNIGAETTALWPPICFTILWVAQTTRDSSSTHAISAEVADLS
jgi:hypothetical protein